MKKLIPLILLLVSFESKAQNAFTENQTTDTTYDIRLFYPVGEAYLERLLTSIEDSTFYHILLDRVRLVEYLERNDNEVSGYLLWLNGDTIMCSPKDSLYISWNRITSKPSLQPQLNGTGFVKATGTTISYDNSTYLTAEVDGSVTNELEPVGVIEMFGGTSAPTGYFLCDGSAVSRTTYAALFSVVGTTYGVGDGSTTFNLPDLTQRFPLGKATSGTGSALGSTGGNIDHLHTVNPPNTTTGQPSGTSGQLVGVINVASATHTHDVDIAQFNSGTSNPPFISLNFIIKY